MTTTTTATTTASHPSATVGQSGRPAPGAPAATPSRLTLFDRFIGSDPGLNRLRSALMTVLTIGAILWVEWLFVHLTGALQVATPPGHVSAAETAQLAVTNHDFLVIAMLLGAIIGMISGFGVSDATAKGQFTTMLFLPLPMVAALTLGISLGGHRTLALASLVMVLAVGTYLRRFGPRGLVAGMLLFMGDFFGFFLHGEIGLSDLGWVTSFIAIGLAVAMVIRFTLFYPKLDRGLARTQRSYVARTRAVTTVALALFEAHGDDARLSRRLQRNLTRLNEAALMVDAQLGDPRAIADGSSGQALHQRLFDLELAVSNMARFAGALGRLDLDDEQAGRVRRSMQDVIAGDHTGARAEAESIVRHLNRSDGTSIVDNTTPVLLHRFATSTIDMARAAEDWEQLGRAAGTESGADQQPYVPPVTLFGGWLPGSAQVSAAASTERGQALGDRVRLAPYTRTAIQMAVAVGLAVLLGDMLSPRRFYWAVIAAFITFMGANNSGEQARKGAFRVLGTVVGIGIGSLLATAIGHHTYWSIAVILVSLFLGFYLMRINYAFMVVGITVMVSQLYVQLGEFSNSLLLLRLEETALGAGVAIATVFLVLPLRTSRVLRVAMRGHVETLSTLIDHASHQLVANGEPTDSTLRNDARNLDASYQAVIATVQPLRRTVVGTIDRTVDDAIRLATASRNLGRNLVVDIESAGPLDAETRAQIDHGAETLHHSLDVVATALNGPRQGTYTRSASIFDQSEHRLESSSLAVPSAQPAIRDLKLLDQSMARLAELMRLGVTDFDTVDLTTRV